MIATLDGQPNKTWLQEAQEEAKGWRTLALCELVILAIVLAVMLTAPW